MRSGIIRSVENPIEHPLVSQLVDDVGGSQAQWFLDLLSGIESEGILRRRFEFNTTDVVVDFTEGWAEIIDILYGDAEPHRVGLAWLRDRVARSSS